MSWFDQEKLKTALQKGKIPVDENTLIGLGNWLFVMEHVFQLPSRQRFVPSNYNIIGIFDVKGGPSEELKELAKALGNWIDAEFANKPLELRLVASGVGAPGPVPLLVSLSTLCIAITNAIDYLRSAAGSAKQKEQIETSLFIALYEKYIELSGSKKLSDNGPGIRFIKECASILGVTAPDGLRRRLQQAIASRQEKPLVPHPDLSGLIEQLKFFFPETNNFAPLTTAPFGTAGSSQDMQPAAKSK